MEVFDRLAPFIKEYIYKNHWEELREIQVAACDVIFNTDDNLLLASGTASGKTEAAFLPILTELYEKPSSSVGILYISPLKALINDQFNRLDNLLQEADIPVTKWHGDAPTDKKKKILKNPKGIIQITPESLESMLLNRKGEILHLFSDLRFIIIDEVHYFMGNERGIQLISILERISRLTKYYPRRIGLSATLGNSYLAADWLNAATGRNCCVPDVRSSKRSIRLAVEYFIVEKQDDKMEETEDKYYQYLYNGTKGKKCIIFANSRSKVEHTIAVLKHLAIKKGSPDIYRIHHGNISAAYREDTEKEMKEKDGPVVTGATITLELGIDIGTLDRVIQLQSPYTVSSFVQRLGRCGRRGQVAEMLFVFRNEKNSQEDILCSINWGFIQCIAIIQLYIREHWIEPSYQPNCPFSILYHQTMSYVASMGEVSLPGLAQYILTLFPFKKISQDDYKQLIKNLLEIEHLEKSESGGIIIGIKGEKIVNHYDFYSVFETPQEYSVKWENKTVGTVDKLYPLGYQFELAGQAWEVRDIVEKSHVIFVNSISGISKISWDSNFIYNFETKVVKEMINVLCLEERFPFLSVSAMDELISFRELFTQGQFLGKLIVNSEGKYQYRILPWIGTKGLRVLSLALKARGIENKISGLWLDVCYEDTIEKLEDKIREIINNGIKKEKLKPEDDFSVQGKYNKFIPKYLLQKQFIEDYIDVDEIFNIQI